MREDSEQKYIVLRSRFPFRDSASRTFTIPQRYFAAAAISTAKPAPMAAAQMHTPNVPNTAAVSKKWCHCSGG